MSEVLLKINYNKCTVQIEQNQPFLQFLNKSPVAPHKSFTMRGYLYVTAALLWISDTLIQVQSSITKAQQRFTFKEKTMNKLFFVGLALTACISLAGFSLCGSSVAAQGGQSGQQGGQGGQGQRPPGPPPQGEGRRGGPDGEGRMLRMLDLTSDQKDQIKKLHDAEQATAKPIHEQLKTMHEQLRAATKDGAFNESAVRSLLAQTQQPELELEVIRFKTRAAIHDVLTPAQKAKLAESQAAKEKNHDGPPPRH